MNDMKSLLAKAGYAFSFVNATLGAAASQDILIKCPAASSSFFGALLEAKVYGDTKGLAALFEAPTTSADGAAATALNKNRLVTVPTTVVTSFSGPTVGGGGTQTGTQLVSGLVALAEPWCTGSYILAPATNYLLRVTNNDVSAARFLLRWEFVQIPNQDFTRNWDC